MTPTATAPPSTELRKLEQARERAYTDLQKVKRELGAYDDETDELKRRYTEHGRTHPEQLADRAGNPKPDTEAAKLQATVKGRQNPHVEAFESLKAKFHAADAAVQEFRRARVGDLLAERHPTFERSIAKIRDGFALVREGCDEYGRELVEAQSVVAETPGLSAREFSFDTRPEQWRRDADAALTDDDILLPRLTELGAWKVNQQ